MAQTPNGDPQPHAGTNPSSPDLSEVLGQDPQDESRIRTVRLASALELLAAAWLIAAPFVLGYSGEAMTNDIIIGSLMLVLVVPRLADWTAPPGLSWATLALGAWLIAAPFVLAYSERLVPLLNDIIVGVLVAALGAWGALASPRPDYVPFRR